MIYFMPIEQFPERYTQQWFDWFTTAADEFKIRMEIINPPSLKTNLETGAVLDIYNTNYYKCQQTAEIMKLFNDGKVKDGDVFFYMDAWGVGLESLEYVRLASGIKFKICGILHAGTWDPADFTTRLGFKKAGMHHLEASWLQTLDEIYVASDFHKELIKKAHSSALGVNVDKIKVVNFPLKLKDGYQSFKERRVIFPHRLDPEKRPEYFEELERVYKSLYPDDTATFIKSKDVCNDKDDYYSLLSSSKVAVSFALQETFGIAMLEACVHGCIPLVPDKLSYKEMYPKIFQYPAIKRSTHDASGAALPSSTIKYSCDFEDLAQRVKFSLDNFDIQFPIVKNIYSKYYNGAEEILAYVLSFASTSNVSDNK